jgi:tetratricopeptide (TPR) repeat protein
MSPAENQTPEFHRLLKSFQEARDRDDVKAAESLAVQCLAFVAQKQALNPSESHRLVQEAIEHEDAARWEQAEAARRRVLALAETEGIQAIICKAHMDLSNLFTLCGLTDRALQEAGAAVEAARKSELVTLLVTALADLSRCCLAKGDVASAAAAADEAVQTTPAEKMQNMQRARALLARARCRTEQGQVAEAESDLDVAWSLLEPLAEASMFAGVQGSLASWWEITARIRVQSKDLAGAAEAWGKAVELRRAVSHLPQLEGPYKYFSLAKTLHQYSHALSAAGGVQEAVRAFDESSSIHEKLGTAQNLQQTP